MGGFAGLAPPAGSAPITARFLTAPALAGQPARRAAAGLCIWGRRDIALAEDRGGALALAGYARAAGRPIAAAELLARWRHEGPALLDSLGGEFALAVIADGAVWIARDRLGTRPLYFVQRGEATWFASAIGPLVAAGAPIASDREAVVTSLVLGYVPAPRTALAGVEQLAPGEWLRLAPRRARAALRPCRLDEHPRRGLAAAARALDRTVTRAVEDALPVSDGDRVGAFLSGGIDSSLVLARLVEAGRTPTAYTLHFGDHLPGELTYARAVARHLGVRHHVMTLDARRFCDALEPALLHLEDLLSEPIAVPNFLLARAAARECDVLFTGEGGDPPFGGPKNIGLVLAWTYRHHPLAPSLPASYLAAHHHLYEDLDEALDPEWRASFDERRLIERLVEPLLAPAAGTPAQSFVGRLMLANILLKGRNNILVKVAKMVGAHDVALRSPLFDARVVDLALTIPPWQKLVGTEEKLVLKQAAARSLPRIVLERPKRGMAVPLRAWFDGALGRLARDVLTERAVRERGLFRWPYVRSLLEGQSLSTELARPRGPEKLWLVLIAELHQRALERLARAAGDAAAAGAA